MNEAKILVVDDEDAVREMIATALELAGFDCYGADGAQKAYELIMDNRPDLVLLDWMMPGVTGVELTRRLKREEVTEELPVILLTAKTDETNKVQGLDAGADDYITKPFSTRELVSRIHAVLRRTNAKSNKREIVIDSLRLNPVSHRVTVDERPVPLGPTEYRLLEFFMTHPDRAYSRAQLLDQVWGTNVYVEDRTVDVHIRRLRKALAPFYCDYLIQTIRGTGYRFSGG